MKFYKIMNRLVGVFNGLCIFLPFGMAVILALVYMLGGWEWLIPGHDLSFYGLPALNHLGVGLMILALEAVIIYCIAVFRKKIDVWRGGNTAVLCAVTAVGIFLTALFLRLFFIAAFQEQLGPFSDFKNVWDMANGYVADQINYYSLFPTYVNWANFERYCIGIFGENFFNIIILNCILASGTAVIIYLIGRIVLSDESYAVLAGLLYSFLPSNIAYCATATPEFLTITLNSIGILLFVRTFEQRGYRQVLAAGLGSVFIGIGSAYKSFGIIIIIAYWISVIIQLSIGYCAEIKGTCHIKKEMMVLLCLLLVTLGGYRLSRSYILSDTENKFGVELDYAASMPHFLLIGLNTEAEGRIGMGTLSRLYYTEYLGNGHDLNAAKQYAKDILAEDWKNHAGAVVPNLLKKMIWAFQDDVQPLRYYNTNAGIDPNTRFGESIYTFTTKYAGTLSQLYYWLLFLFATIGCILYWQKGKIYCSREFFMLIVFGYFCLMIISEVQSRYKCLIMPYLCIQSIMGAADLLNWVKERRKGRLSI